MRWYPSQSHNRRTEKRRQYALVELRCQRQRVIDNYLLTYCSKEHTCCQVHRSTVSVTTAWQSPLSVAREHRHKYHNTIRGRSHAHPSSRHAPCVLRLDRHLHTRQAPARCVCILRASGHLLQPASSRSQQFPSHPEPHPDERNGYDLLPG